MSKLFYMDKSGEYRELCKLAETHGFLDYSDANDKTVISFINKESEIIFTADYNSKELQKILCIVTGINKCEDCGRESRLLFPHIGSKTYCSKCLMKRMK